MLPTCTHCYCPPEYDLNSSNLRCECKPTYSCPDGQEWNIDQCDCVDIVDPDIMLCRDENENVINTLTYTPCVTEKRVITYFCGEVKFFRDCIQIGGQGTKSAKKKNESKYMLAIYSTQTG